MTFIWALVLLTILFTIVYFISLSLSVKFHKQLFSYKKVRLLSVSRRGYDLSLLVVLLLHITIALWKVDIQRVLEIRVEERSAAMIALKLKGSWEGYLLHSVYNPFPADIGLYTFFSHVTSLQPISGLLFLIISSSMIVACDLALYSSVTRLANDPLAGVLTVLLLIFTPAISLPAPQQRWISDILVIFFILTLAKLCKAKDTQPLLLMLIILYTSSIFYHPSGTISVIIVLGIIIVFSFFKKNSNLKLSMFVLLTVITFAKNAFAAGSLEALIPTLKNFIIASLSGRELKEAVPRSELVLSPIHAYAWSMIPSMSSAYAIYMFFKRKKDTDALLLQGLYVGGALFAFLGFLGVIFRAPIRGPALASYLVLAPLAGVLTAKVLRTRSIFASVLISTIIIGACISLTDPTGNSLLLRTQRGTAINAGIRDFEEALLFSESIPYDKDLFAPHEVVSCMSYISVAEVRPWHKFIALTALPHRNVINQLLDNVTITKDTIYIWPERWHPDIASFMSESGLRFSVYYTSGRYTIFEQA